MRASTSATIPALAAAIRVNLTDKKICTFYKNKSVKCTEIKNPLNREAGSDYFTKMP
jgi:hypothetical protein